MAETVNDKHTVLTEEMIDAAMSKRLKDMAEELSLFNQEKIKSDHIYCEEEYSSDSDYQVESIDGSSSESQEENTSLNNSSVCKAPNDTSIEDKTKLQRETIQNGDNDESNDKIKTPTVLQSISDKVTVLNLESASHKLDSSVKKGLIIKPITNLLKADLVQDSSKNVKIFKCINGKIELVKDSEISPAEKQKYLMYKNSFQNTKTGSNLSSTYFENLALNDSNKKTKRINHEESQGEPFNDVISKNGDSQDCSVVNRSAQNSSNTNSSSSCKNSSAIHIPNVESNSLDKTPTLNSLLKTNVNKLNNVIEPKIINSESVENSVDIVPMLPTLKDVESKKITDSTDTVVEPANVLEITPEKETSTSNYDDDDDDDHDDQISLAAEDDGVPVGSVNTAASKINTTKKSVKAKSENKQPYVYRRQILPKINYRYHSKDRLVISDKLPNNKTVISGNNKKNTKNSSNCYKVATEVSNAKNILIMTPESAKNQQKLTTTQSLIRLKSPPSAVSTKYVRNVINSIITPTSTVAVSKTNNSSVSSKLGLIKTKTLPSNSKSSSIGSENWEKLDRFTLNNERNKGDSGLNALTSQILDREVPVYKPVGTNEVYPCLECGDRFVFESSLREHKLRRSVLIIYWCRTCSCCLNIYNRCMFLSHIRSHNQSFRNLDMTCLSVEPIPKHLLRLTSDVPDITADRQSSTLVTANVVPVSNSSTVITSPSLLVSLQSAASTGTTESSEKESSATTTLNVPNTVNPAKKSQTVMDVVTKLVPSELHRINANTDDTTEQSRVVCDGVSDVVILNEEGISNNPHSEKNKEVPEDDVEITVSNVSTEEVAEHQYSNTIVSASDKVDPEVNLKKQVKGRRKCPECGIFITAKCSVRKHLQNFNKPLTDVLKCEICQLILQSPCALKMHLRIHLKTKPFRCPECAIEFNIFDRFMMHLKYTCCHMTKVVRYICSVCSSMQVSATVLEQHLLTRHVRSIYKCGSCPVAFISVNSATKHKEKEHAGRIVPTHFYQQCKLCPEKLIPKKRFLLHMKNHLNDEKVRVYAYQCPTCRFTFFHRTELVYHRMKCDTRDGIIRSVLEEFPVQEVENGDPAMIATKNEAELEFISPSKKRKLSNEDEIELVQEEEKDPLSLEDFQIEEPLQEPLEETCIVCKTEKVLILPGRKSSQSMCCKKCVSPCGVQVSDSVQRNKLMAAKLKGYKCKICNTSNYMDLKSIFVHFKNLHKEFEGQSINEWLIIENSASGSKKSNTVTTAETIKEKYKKKRASSTMNAASQVVQIKQEPDDTVIHKNCNPPEKKKPKKCIKLKQKAISEVKKFESGQIIVTQKEENSEFSCSKCDFVDANKEEFVEHVISHRTDPNALQCLECGECFIVLPSLEKHLIISHRITDVDKYVADNKNCLPMSSNEDDLMNAAANDDGECTTCKVCYEVFESKTALDKHFRSHGMAFLFKKQQ